MIFNTAKVVMAALTLGAMTTACSDWDDHYDANGTVTGSATSTLWENISANKNLSDFAALAKKAGYDQVLSNPQTYTVWAPLNGSFDYETLNNMDLATMKKQFMQNHVAHFNYPASGSVDESIYMINEKMKRFVGNGTYTMGGLELVQPNIPNSNGTLHAINGKLDFGFNIYESINANDYPLDSVSAYFAKYDMKSLDVENSVKGPVVDGQITYLDSVLVEYNALANSMRAYINNEDSNYTMILPTNEAWIEKKQYVDALLDYLPSYQYTNTFYEKYDSIKKSTERDLVDNAYLSDSLSHLLMVGNLAFNNNRGDNVKLNKLQTGQTLQADSLVSTVGLKFYSEDAADLFKDAKRIDKSNGAVWVTNTLGFKPWHYKVPIKVEGEYGSNIAGTFKGDVSYLTVNDASKNDTVEGRLSNNSYAEVRANTATSNPEIDYYLPRVYKGKYVLYICVAPSNINKNTYQPSMLPNQMQIKYGYHENKNNVGMYVEKTLARKVSNDPTKVDTIRIGEVDFPYATVGLEKAMPYVRIMSNVTSSKLSVFDRTLRIDYIYLIPKELDDYIQQHPDYKWEDESDK